METTTKLIGAMFPGYVEAMRWANMFREATLDDGPLELGLVPAHEDRGFALSADAHNSALADCRDFWTHCETEAPEEFALYFEEFNSRQFGMDFALSRNGHGAGFFDRGPGFPTLQGLAKRYGTNSWIENEETETVEILE